ncbi:glycosyltransferase [Acidisphaera sp. S103]|uniref:glycosyltransferase n=1 Tax=Acidisphaera sp. S103 TaxID=1747223 RepID=UPI00131D4946|nr:glycosyltransferase [Acidisphaera sp. S103]
MPTSENADVPTEGSAPSLSRSRIALGIVTYNSPPSQVRRLTKSVEMAANRAKFDGYETVVFTTDCGAPTEWGTSSVRRTAIDSIGNIGFGRGMNRLMSAAFADAETSSFICINPDGLLHHDLIIELCNTSLQYPESLIEARQFPEEHPKPYDPVTGLTLWASGACMLINRQIYEKVGGFDPNIFMYMEDVDLSWRARSAGFSVRVAPRALFGHSVLDRKPDPGVEKHYYTSAIYLAHKWRQAEMRARYEREIIERGMVIALATLPESQMPEQADSSPVTFAHGFVFSPRRWG